MSTPDAAADRELTTSRRIAASREAVWAAMTDPHSLAIWWGPDGFTNTNQVCDIRGGGSWRLVMHAPDGTDYPNELRFAELVAPQRWVVEHLSKPKFRLTVVLTAAGAETEVRWTQTFERREDCDALRAICVPANEQNLSRLAAVVGNARR